MSEQLYCKNSHRCYNEDCFSCTQLLHAKYSHYEYISAADTQDWAGTWFDCLNRYDEKGKLFQRSIYQTKFQSIKLSRTLNYTNEFFMCNEHIMPWTSQSFDWLLVSGETCTLDGSIIRAAFLLRLLLMDFSFKGREEPKIGEFFQQDDIVDMQL